MPWRLDPDGPPSLVDPMSNPLEYNPGKQMSGQPFSFKRIVGSLQGMAHRRERLPQSPAVAFACTVCGNDRFSQQPVLWRKLIEEWQLSPDEAALVDRREGTACTQCHASYRSMALAAAICAVVGSPLTLQAFVVSAEASELKLLEINTAGTLNPTLRQMPGHRLAAYPEVDMLRMPYVDRAFDLIVHSDTLEHVPNPVAALAECRRVLKPGGCMCYTIPIIAGRMSRTRAGLEPSYHGNGDERGGDWAVQTEYGADAWVEPLKAGFTNVAFHALDYPVAYAIIAS